MQIDKHQNIQLLLKKFPECEEFFYPFLGQLSTETTIEQLAATHAVSQSALLLGLERYLKRIQHYRCDFDDMRRRLIKPGQVNIAGYTHFLLQEGLCNSLNKLARDSNIPLNLNLFPKHEKKKFQNYLALCSSPDDLPEILVGKGFSSLNTSRFFDKFIRPGHFTHPLKEPVSGEAFQPVELADRSQAYHAFGIEEALMVYDHSLCSSVSMPRSWEEILSDSYRNSLTQMGKSGQDHFGFIVMLYLYCAFGAEGIARFASNVKRKQHFAVTVKNIGRKSDGVAPVNIMHSFAARFIRSDAKDTVQRVEPADGNPTVCHFLLLKKNASHESELLAQFLFSDAVQAMLKSSGITPVSAFEKRRMRWIGWDTLGTLPLPFLKDQLAEIAFQYYKKSAL